MNHETIYSFALPNVVEDVKFTCVFCGGPAISGYELNDEIVCDVCYAKKTLYRDDIDDQYCFENKCRFEMDEIINKIKCTGRCARCVL